MIVLANLVMGQCTVCYERTSTGPRTKSNGRFRIFRGLVVAGLSYSWRILATFRSFDNGPDGPSLSS
jgi:hypothetical protein